MRVDFSETPDAQSFSPLPDGHYECEVKTCVESPTAKGDTKWQFGMEVLAGEYKGRKIYDGILFQLGDMQGMAMRRTKFVLSRMGFVVEKALQIEPVELVGRKVIVTCSGTEDYQNKKGEKRTKNIVPFDGYEKHGDQAEDDLPF